MDKKTADRLKFIINTVYLGLIVLIVYVLLKYVVRMLLPLLLSAAAVAAAHPLAQRIARRLGLKRKIASVMVVIAIYIVIGGAITLIITGLVVAVREALPLLPRYYENAIEPALSSAQKAFTQFQEALPGLFRLPADTFSLAPTLQTLLNNISRAGLEALSGFTGKVPSFLITVLFTVMLSFFISIHYDEAAAFLTKNTPPKVSGVFREAKAHLFDAVIRYLGAVLTMMAITFCELFAGLSLLGLSNAVIVAAGIALLDALPVIGSGTALVPWAIIELLRGNVFFGVGLILLWGVILFVKSTIEPKIVGDRLGLNPIVSLTAIFVGYRLFGFAGMILMPITAHILIMLYKNGSFSRSDE